MAVLKRYWDVEVSPIKIKSDAEKVAAEYIKGQPGLKWTHQWGYNHINVCCEGSTEVEVGPIWNDYYANCKALEYVRKHPGSRWTGVWTTTEAGKMSVLSIEYYGTPDNGEH